MQAYGDIYGDVCLSLLEHWVGLDKNMSPKVAGRSSSFASVATVGYPHMYPIVNTSRDRNFDSASRPSRSTSMACLARVVD
jgi:hypothetical protein